MFGIGIFELLAIFVVVLLVLGPDKLPAFARSMAKFVGDFRRVSNELTSSVLQTSQAIEMDSEPRVERGFLTKSPAKKGSAGTKQEGIETIAKKAEGEVVSSSKER